MDLLSKKYELAAQVEKLKQENDTLKITREKLLGDLCIAEESLKDYEEHYKHSEQENQELKKELERIRNTEFGDLVEQHKILGEKLIETEQENAELKKENKRLKELKCKFKEYCTCNTEKYVQCLQEIKEIAEQMLNKNEFVYMSYENVRQIIRLITKAEVGE